MQRASAGEGEGAHGARGTATRTQPGPTTFQQPTRTLPAPTRKRGGCANQILSSAHRTPPALQSSLEQLTRAGRRRRSWKRAASRERDHHARRRRQGDRSTTRRLLLHEVRRGSLRPATAGARALLCRRSGSASVVVLIAVISEHIRFAVEQCSRFRNGGDEGIGVRAEPENWRTSTRTSTRTSIRRASSALCANGRTRYYR